jgi:dipeptidyl aminopeptidase/acylaminoacyl peptidase
MKTIIFFNLLLCLAFRLYPQKNGTILSRESVVFPTYDSVPNISWYYDRPTYQEAIADTSISYQKIFYNSNGLKVAAYFVTPVQPKHKTYPVIIFNRGSYIRNDIAFVHAPLFQKFVNNGFIVIAPALRQSEGGEGKDELGGNDLADIMNIYPMLSILPLADTANTFMLGESRGGMMTYQAIRDKFPLKAAASIGAITDLSMYLTDRPWDEKGMPLIIADYEENKEKVLKHRSVLSWVEKINVPVLILHGSKDPQVKPHHALLLSQALTDAGKEYELGIFSGGNHILSASHTDQRDEYVIRWFRKFIH